MIKLCGALMVFGVSALCGIGCWQRMRLRLRLLDKLTVAFQMLQTEIVFVQTPLPQAVLKVEKQVGCLLLERFAQQLYNGVLPQRAMEKACADAEALHREDTQLLVQIALGLGCSDTETQSLHMDSALRRLAERKTQAAEALQNNGRLYLGAGVLGGLLLVILLV